MADHQNKVPEPVPGEQLPQPQQPPEAPCDDEQDTMGFTGLGLARSANR